MVNIEKGTIEEVKKLAGDKPIIVAGRHVEYYIYLADDTNQWYSSYCKKIRVSKEEYYRYYEGDEYKD